MMMDEKKEDPMTAPRTQRAPANVLPVENALGRIRIAQPKMAKSAQRIARFILERPQEIVGMSVTELSEATGVSEGSVINFCRSIGCQAFSR
jgi:DNA-binding MurR/RpiR family transcriptional regulator